MTETQFIEKNEKRWQQLEEFNQILQKRGIRSLEKPEIQNFAETFRAVGYHLAYAKTHFPNGSSLPYLTHIVGLAHNFYYVKEAGSFRAVKDYFLFRFPEICRETLRYSTIAFIIFILGTIFAFVYVATDVSRFSQISPFEVAADLGDGEVVWDYAFMSAYIMTNNIRVSIMVFVFGITAGIGTAFILFYNGMILGAIAAHVAVLGSPRDMLVFWALILPHGVPELAAIFISGACGLLIGRAIIIPGDYSRKESIISSARQAAELIPGIVAILIISGLIEGFFTPMAVSPFIKLGFSFLILLLLWYYFSRKRSIPQSL